MTLTSCGNKIVPVVDSSGTNLPAWPQFMEPKPYSKQDPDADGRTAAIARHGELKVCNSQLRRGKAWYYEDLVDALKGAKK